MMWIHVKEWAGVIALGVTALAWTVGALGFQGETTGHRLEILEVTAVDLRTFKADQERVNKSLLIWMCVTDRQSAVMAQVPCTALGVDHNGEVQP